MPMSCAASAGLWGQMRLREWGVPSAAAPPTSTLVGAPVAAERCTMAGLMRGRVMRKGVEVVTPLRALPPPLLLPLAASSPMVTTRVSEGRMG